MRLVFKYTINTYVGISNFLLIWCLTREKLRQKKLLRLYGCGLDLTDFPFFQHKIYPANLQIVKKNVIYMESASPQKIINKMNKISTDKTLIVFHPQPITPNLLKQWVISPKFPNAIEKKILYKIMSEKTSQSKEQVNVIHVRCGDKISFNFTGDNEDIDITENILHKICQNICEKYSKHLLITDSQKLAYIAKNIYNINVKTQSRTHSVFLQEDKVLRNDINILLQSKNILNVNIYDQPSCLSLLCSKLVKANYETITIQEFIT